MLFLGSQFLFDMKVSDKTKETWWNLVYVYHCSKVCMITQLFKILFRTKKKKKKNLILGMYVKYMRHDKTNKMSERLSKTQVILGIRPVWSESSLSAWRKLESLATHWAHSEDSDQTGRMPRLIWVFGGSTLILLVLSCRGSNVSGVVGIVGRAASVWPVFRGL